MKDDPYLPAVCLLPYLGYFANAAVKFNFSSTGIVFCAGMSILLSWVGDAMVTPERLEAHPRQD